MDQERQEIKAISVSAYAGVSRVLDSIHNIYLEDAKKRLKNLIDDIDGPKYLKIFVAKLELVAISDDIKIGICELKEVPKCVKDILNKIDKIKEDALCPAR